MADLYDSDEELPPPPPPMSEGGSGEAASTSTDAVEESKKRSRVNSDDEETHPAPVSFHRQTKQRIESNSDLRNAYVEIGSGSRK